MRILHLSSSTPAVIAGAERVILEIVRGAGRQGWEIEFGTVRPSGLLNSAVSSLGVSTFSLGSVSATSVLPAAVRLVDRVRRTKPDLIHVHLARASVIGAMAGRLTGVPVVQTRHYASYVRRFRGRVAARVDAVAARACARVAAVSEAVRVELVAEGVDERRICVIPNCVPSGELEAVDAPHARRRVSEMASRPVIVCAASLQPWKGQADLLRAFRLVLDSSPSASLLFLGTGPDRDRLGELAVELGVKDRVYFLGHRDDRLEFMAGADVYVQPSSDEAFGLAAAEAMSLATPVVVSACGGLRELVQEGETGLTYPVGDVRSLADAVLQITRERPLAQRLAANARSSVAARFAPDQMLSRYRDLYAQVLTR